MLKFFKHHVALGQNQGEQGLNLNLISTLGPITANKSQKHKICFARIIVYLRKWIRNSFIIWPKLPDNK